MLCSARNNFDGTSGFELRERTFAFYGFGFVAKGFGMNIVAYDPYIPKEAIAAFGATPVESVQALFECQYVSLHVPLTDETKASINKDLMLKLPKGGTLINTARAEVIDESGMLEVLRAR